MEARNHSLCGAATPRRRPGSGGANRRQPTWPLAAREQSRTHHRFAKRLLRLTRLSLRRGASTCIIRRTAGYGPVCPGGVGGAASRGGHLSRFHVNQTQRQEHAMSWSIKPIALAAAISAVILFPAHP